MELTLHPGWCVSEKLPTELRARSTSVPEVEFALVLSRLIASAKDDPVQLRTSIYQIALVQLREQLADKSPAEAQTLLQALETAIVGVEQFSAGDVHARGAANLLAHRGAHDPSDSIENRLPAVAPGRAAPAQTMIEYVPVSRRLGWLMALLRFSAIAAVVTLVVVLAYQQRVLMKMVTPPGPGEVAGQGSFGDKWAPLQAARPEPAQSAERPLVPEFFGIFARSGEALYELQSIPGRVPDPRVSISAAIVQPAKVKVPDGRVDFIVYRRDAVASGIERAELRVVARTKSAPAAQKQGKDEEPSWVIRNVLRPVRAAPIKDKPDMYELKLEETQSVLPAGRYALVLKGTAYDFEVAGEITDPQQCLQRLEAANGVFYFECKP